MEQNKTGKPALPAGRYLKYAIGEIILVVIGILIALQINNWNEHKKEQKQEQIYLKNLQEDLKGIIAAYGVALEFEKLILQQSHDIITHYEKNNGFYNMDTIFPKLNDLTFRWGTTANSTTLAEMINSGQTKLISNTRLRKELIDFNEELELWSTNTLNNNTNLVDNLIVPEIIKSAAYGLYGYSKPMKTIASRIIGMKQVLSVKDSTMASIALENLNNAEQKLTMINLVNYRYTIASLQVSVINNTKQRVEQLITTIETELK
jgi:hypothetical protein